MDSGAFLKLSPVGISSDWLLSAVKWATTNNCAGSKIGPPATSTAGVRIGQVLGHDIAGIIVVRSVVPATRRRRRGLYSSTIGNTNQNRTIGCCPEIDRFVCRDIVNIHRCHFAHLPPAYCNCFGNLIYCFCPCEVNHRNALCAYTLCNDFLTKGKHYAQWNHPLVYEGKKHVIEVKQTV